MPQETISLRFTFVALLLSWIFYDNFIKSIQADKMVHQRVAGLGNAAGKIGKRLQCPDTCACWPPEAMNGAGDLDLEVTCETGGLNDRSLAKLLPGIPKIATVIRIEAPPWNPNNFTLTQDLVKFTKLNRLILENCGLPSLGKRTLESMKHLKSLELPNNRIRFLSPDTFINLDGIENLDLSRNSLNADVLPTGTFAHLSGLISLNLSDNLIGNFASNFFSGLKKLKLLSMSGNLLNGLNDFDLFRDLPALQEINLARCQLTHLPERAFENNRYLTTINLAGNRLSVRTLKTFFGNHPNLKYVDLSDNSLTEIPDRFFNKLPNLRGINLASNVRNSSDRVFPEKFLRPRIFGNSTQIEHLNLSDNKFFEFDSDFYLWPISKTLRSLDLSNNPLSAISPNHSKSLTNLRHLYLANTRLARLPEEPPIEYENLEFLDLSHNVLSYVSPNFLAALKSIKMIDFSFNRLETFTHFLANFSRKLTGHINLHNNKWKCDCETIGLLQDYLLASKMRRRCRQMFYQNITCDWPVQVRNIPVVLMEKSVECSAAYYRSQSFAFYEQPGLGVLTAGICGAILLLGLLLAMAYSYFFSPQASYRTNEEKVILSTSASIDSASDRSNSESGGSELTGNTTDPLC